MMKSDETGTGDELAPVHETMIMLLYKHSLDQLAPSAQYLADIQWAGHR